jgi:hypothetical protein
MHRCSEPLWLSWHSYERKSPEQRSGDVVARQKGLDTEGEASARKLNPGDAASAPDLSRSISKTPQNVDFDRTIPTPKQALRALGKARRLFDMLRIEPA